jgi:hypothetical protein
MAGKLASTMWVSLQRIPFTFHSATSSASELPYRRLSEDTKEFPAEE